MGTGASKSFDRSINALKIVKRMQKPLNSAEQSETNSALDNKMPMPVNGVQKSENGNANKMMSEPEATKTSLHETSEFKEMKDQSAVKNKEAEDSVDVVSPQGNDDSENEEEEKVLTEEEIVQKIDEYYEKLSSAIIQGKSFPVRDLSEEGQPYTALFRAFALKMGKSYFYFKPGRIPYAAVKQFRLKTGKCISETKCADFLCDALADGLNRRDFCDEEGKTKIMYYLPLKNCLLTLMNYSDACKEFKLSVGSHRDLLSSMLDLVKDWKDQHLQSQLKDNQTKVLKWCVSIFHNVATVDENVPLLRDLGVLQAILPYLDSPLSTMRLAAVATLADIVNEEEAKLLQTNHSIYQFLLKTLRLSLKGVGHKNLGWSAEELTRAVRQLARNDANKQILVDLGCLPLLVELLQIGTEPEIKEALDCLWILSFNANNKTAMMSEDSLVDHVVQQFHEGTGTTKYSCHGLLWSLKDQLLTEDKYKTVGNEVSTSGGKAGVEKKSPESPDTPLGPQFQGHVMISYQWANQETIKHIAHELRAKDIPIWLDIDYMGGSTLQAMARAVENSFIVIVAMSQKYKDSPNTRAEAEYAFQQRKTIIPLIMQQGYQPDGWLGLILGSKLYYDFSGKYSFESRMGGLLKAILNLQDHMDGKLSPDQPMITPSIAPVLASPVKPVARSVPVKDKEIKGWTSDDVKQWLTKFKLENVVSMTTLSGEEILFLFKLKVEAPEFFYHCLETKLKLDSILDLSRATDAISDLDA